MTIEALLKEAKGTEPVVLDLAVLFRNWLRSSVKLSGSSGPFSWEAEYYLNKEDLQNSYAAIRFCAFGVEILSARLDFQNPVIVVTNAKPMGIPLSAEAGIDFSDRTLYIEVTVSNLVHRWVIATF